MQPAFGVYAFGCNSSERGLLNPWWVSCIVDQRQICCDIDKDADEMMVMMMMVGGWVKRNCVGQRCKTSRRPCCSVFYRAASHLLARAMNIPLSVAG